MDGKVVIITGCGDEVGCAVAVLMSRQGAQVVVTDTLRDKVLESAKRCDESCLYAKKWHSVNGKWIPVQRALPFVLDYKNDSECQQLIDSVVSRFGRIDLLVMNLVAKGMTSMSSFDTYDEIMAIELRSLVFLTHLTVPYLETTNGNIINISNTTAIKAEASLVVKCMAKSAVEMFIKCLALELGPKRIRINSITHLIPQKDSIDGLEVNQELMNAFVDRLPKNNPLGQIFRAEDVAKAVLYLASNESDFLNGVTLVVDAGSGLQ